MKNGEAPLVPDAEGADADRAPVDGDGGRVVEAGQAEVEPVDDDRRHAPLRARARRPAARRCRATRARRSTAIAVALAAELVGVAQRAMEMAVEYAKDRKQFGRPIGAYQAVSHRCAQMLLETEGARSARLYAAWAADPEPESLPLAASMAKAYASDAGWRVTASSLQVHGGIGFTWEHDLHFFLKRAKTDGHLFGSAREHRERVAELSGLAARPRPPDGPHSVSAASGGQHTLALGRACRGRHAPRGARRMRHHMRDGHVREALDTVRQVHLPASARRRWAASRRRPRRTAPGPMSPCTAAIGS